MTLNLIPMVEGLPRLFPDRFYILYMCPPIKILKSLSTGCCGFLFGSTQVWGTDTLFRIRPLLGSP